MWIKKKVWMHNSVHSYQNLCLKENFIIRTPLKTFLMKTTSKSWDYCLILVILNFNSILMKDKYCFVNSPSHRDKQYKKKEETFQSKILLLFCTRLWHEKTRTLKLCFCQQLHMWSLQNKHIWNLQSAGIFTKWLYYTAKMQSIFL